VCKWKAKHKQESAPGKHVPILDRVYFRSKQLEDHDKKVDLRHLGQTTLRF
jgi:hypothetical protein